MSPAAAQLLERAPNHLALLEQSAHRLGYGIEAISPRAIVLSRGHLRIRIETVMLSGAELERLLTRQGRPFDQGGD